MRPFFEGDPCRHLSATHTELYGWHLTFWTYDQTSSERSWKHEEFRRLADAELIDVVLELLGQSDSYSVLRQSGTWNPDQLELSYDDNSSTGHPA